LRGEAADGAEQHAGRWLLEAHLVEEPVSATLLAADVLGREGLWQRDIARGIVALGVDAVDDADEAPVLEAVGALEPLTEGIALDLLGVARRDGDDAVR